MWAPPNSSMLSRQRAPSARWPSWWSRWRLAVWLLVAIMRKLRPICASNWLIKTLTLSSGATRPYRALTLPTAPLTLPLADPSHARRAIREAVMPARTRGLWACVRTWLGHQPEDDRQPQYAAPPGSQSDPDERARLLRKQAEIRRRLEVLEIEAGVSARRPPRELRPSEEWQ